LKYVGNYLRTVADFSLNVKRMAAEREREREREREKVIYTIDFVYIIQGGPSEVIQSNISKTSRDREKCFV